jgi:hypothetical protein
VYFATGQEHDQVAHRPELGDLRAPPSATTEGKSMQGIVQDRYGTSALTAPLGETVAAFRRLIDGNARGKIAVTLVPQGAVR